MAIVKNDPETVSEAVLDVRTSRHVHLFSHRNLESRDLLLASQLIDCGGGVGTGSKQEQDGLVGRRFLPNVGNRISDRSHVLFSEDTSDEVLGGKDSTIFTNASDEAKLEEISNGLIEDLLLVVGDVALFRRVFVKEFLPGVTVLLNLLNDVSESGLEVSIELVFGQGEHVKVHLVVHPANLLVTVVNTRTSLQHQVHVSHGQLLRLDQNLQAHQQFEHSLVSFEQTTVNVSVDLAGHPFDDVGDTIFDKLRLGRGVNTVIEQIEELLE